jgi:hypothetical protein
MTQICKCCGVEKTIEQYEHQKNRPSPRKVCKQCRYSTRDIRVENEVAKQRKAQWRKDNKDLLRQRFEKATYGVTKEELGTTACVICGSTHRLCIDHCHTTETVRGILCTQCNSGLGMFRDSAQLLAKAIKYLECDGPHYELDRRVYA